MEAGRLRSMWMSKIGIKLGTNKKKMNARRVKMKLKGSYEPQYLLKRQEVKWRGKLMKKMLNKSKPKYC
jgi:hypothetical protein